jgi:hypothetical protein
MPSNPAIDTCAGGEAAGVSAGGSARARAGAVAQSAGATGGHVARRMGTPTRAKAVHGNEGGGGGLITVETHFRLNFLERGLMSMSSELNSLWIKEIFSGFNSLRRGLRTQARGWSIDRLIYFLF